MEPTERWRIVELRGDARATRLTFVRCAVLLPASLRWSSRLRRQGHGLDAHVGWRLKRVDPAVHVPLMRPLVLTFRAVHAVANVEAAAMHLGPRPRDARGASLYAPLLGMHLRAPPHAATYCHFRLRLDPHFARGPHWRLRRLKCIFFGWSK